MAYFSKMKGSTISPPKVSLTEMAWSFLGSFIGIGVVAYLNYRTFSGTEFIMIIGSFGASAVLIYGAVRSPLAQPRNLVGGHILSAIIGVSAYKLLNGQIWLASALAVSASIFLMHATGTLHPPGGATALIAVTGGPKICGLGYFYVLMPVGLGVLVMLVIALAVNNIPKSRRYPEFWV